MNFSIDKDIEKILNAAILAPSGENCQPWKFKILERKIYLNLVPERDQSLYSWGQRASYLANGAVIENIKIASSHLGYNTDVRLFPELKNEILVAEISLIKSNTQDKVDLFDEIYKRVSNRKPYNKVELPPAILEDLKLVEKEMEFGSILFSKNSDELSKLAHIGAVNEEVMMSNKFLHNFFFSHVNWTKEEDDLKKVGFYIETLELPKPAKKIFKIVRRWGITKFLIKIGFHKLIAKQNKDIYASASNIGIVVINNDTPESFVRAGQLIERLWLKATKHGLSFQPLTGVLFLMLQIKAGNFEKFTKNQINKITNSYADIEKVFGLNNKTIAFMFRIGKSDQPTAKSARFPLSDCIEIN